MKSEELRERAVAAVKAMDAAEAAIPVPSSEGDRDKESAYHLKWLEWSAAVNTANEACIAYVRSLPAPGEAVAWLDELRAIWSAICESMGDTDPYIDPEATDDEVRRDEPVYWACHRLAKLLQSPPLYATAPPQASDPVVALVLAELERATRKFPTWPTDPLHASGVVMEESGELAKAVLQAVYEPHKSTVEDVRTEAIQTAAMAVRFLMSMDIYSWAKGEQHSQAVHAARGG